MEKIGTYEFFDLVLSGELGVLDIDNYVETLSDHYKLNKLKMLLYDIEYCFFCEIEERNSKITSEEIQMAIENLISQNKEIPLKTFGKMDFGKAELNREGKTVVDIQKLLYPYDYLQVYKLIGKIKHYIKIQETEKTVLNFVPQLATNLNTGQISKLFESLVNGQFIPANTNPDSFKWIFGATDQPRPERFKPVSWNEAKRGLRELLTPILGTITNQHIRDIKQLFTKDGKPFVMSKPKKDEHSARCREIEEIVNDLNIEK